MLPSTVSGTDLGDQEWRDALFLSYGIDPPELPPKCNGLCTSLFISYTLDLKKGCLFTTHHNKLRDGVSDLAVKAFTPSHVRNNHLIHPGCAVREGRAQMIRLATNNLPSRRYKTWQKG